MENPNKIQFSSKWLPYMVLGAEEFTVNTPAVTLTTGEQRLIDVKTININTQNAELIYMVRSNRDSEALGSEYWINMPFSFLGGVDITIWAEPQVKVIGNNIIVSIQYGSYGVGISTFPASRFDFRIISLSPPIQDE